ncbi:hypothetical protein EGJ27_12420 [Pseudomonas sp. v388]|nr:hypothetical protein EGJ27_12420 [Pseudomonas sp. v388]
MGAPLGPLPRQHFCVLKNATINKIRNIGVRPADMHTAIEGEFRIGRFSTGSARRIRPAMVAQRVRSSPGEAFPSL